jgi:Fe-S cluster assembly protein SufD
MSERSAAEFAARVQAAAQAPGVALVGWAGREAAQAALSRLVLPGRGQEAWRFVKLGGVLDASYGAASPVAASQVPAGLIGVDEACARLVCVGGVYAPGLSSVGASEGVKIVTMGMAGAPAGLGELAGRAFGEDVFAVLNAATLADGVVVEVGRDVSVKQPIHVIHVGVSGQGGATGYAASRLFVRVGRGSSAALVEEYVGEGASWTNAVTEIVVEDSARLTHVKVQAEALSAQHVARTAVEVGAHGAYDSVTVQFGAGLSRQDTVARLVGGGATCALHGLTLIGGAQESDTHTAVEHVHAHTESDQLHKCVVADEAHAVFNGKIHVFRDAQQIQAYQLNRNLLLSGRAKVDTKPQLEIFADDVKCTHGATIGQLDPEQLFYLQARGLGEGAARELLTYAFAAQVLDKVSVEAVRAALVAELGRRAGR